MPFWNRFRKSSDTNITVTDLPENVAMDWAQRFTPHPAQTRDEVIYLAKEGLTLKQISEKTGVPTRSISNWLHAEGMTTVFRSQGQKDLVLSLAGQGMTNTDIAASTGVPATTVSRWVRQNAPVVVEEDLEAAFQRRVDAAVTLFDRSAAETDGPYTDLVWTAEQLAISRKELISLLRAGGIPAGFKADYSNKSGLMRELRDEEGLDYDQIGEWIGCSPATVRRHIDAH